ncbi:MAG: MFS transporter [Sedimentisphaerales bacterium]|nr:MFS transporter [Sedimentisphaerales bacterium]
MISPFLNYFRTGPDKPVLADSNEITKIYERKRRSVFLSLLFGYSFFYVTRLSFSVAKKSMIDADILNAEQMGKIGFAFFITYAFGKLTNGFLADRSNIRRFMSMGLLVSSLIVIVFGFTKWFLVFVLLWGIHGWFQSMGSAPSGASISQWFSNKERGTRYGLWSMAHSIGEGVTFAVTAVIIAAVGWQWGFWSAGLVSMAVALLMFKMLADRPRTYGLPLVADYKNEHPGDADLEQDSVNKAQFGVIKNPYVWILGISCTAMYVARYGVNSWGVLYLQEAKSYSLITAGFILFLAKMMETIGAVSSGFVSDYFFKSRRNVSTLTYGLIKILGLVILFVAPSTFLFNLDESALPLLTEGNVGPALIDTFKDNGIILQKGAVVTLVESGDNKEWHIDYDKWYLSWKGFRVEQSDTTLIVSRKFNLLHLVGISLFGFGLGGLLVFLGGLIAIDICSKRASGAAMGLVGMFSYVGAAFQDWISGSLIEAGKITVNGRTIHDFDKAFYFWLGAAIFAVLISCTLWRVKPKD